MANRAPSGEATVYTTLPATARLIASRSAGVGGVITYQSLISALLANPGQLYGGYFQVTVTSNNLTLAIKTTAGNDPSATEPVFVNIGGTVRVIAATTSTTKNAGTSWGLAGSANFATLPMDWFAYVVYRAANSTVYISASRFPAGATVNDFSGTSANEKHLFDHSTFATSDQVEVCGRFEATLSETASFNWSVPTYVQGVNLIRTPIKMTRWLTYAPTITSGYSANPTDTIYSYRFLERDAQVMFREATAGTSNTTANGEYSLPFTALTLTNALWGSGPCIMTDDGTLFAGYGYITSGATTILFAKIEGWTDSGDRRINFTPPVLYRVA
jgi:hypothetical protein